MNDVSSMQHLSPDTPISAKSKQNWDQNTKPAAHKSRDSAQEKYNLETIQVLDMNSESCSLATFFFYLLACCACICVCVWVCVMNEHVRKILQNLMVLWNCERLSNRVNRCAVCDAKKYTFQCQAIATSNLFHIIEFIAIVTIDTHTSPSNDCRNLHTFLPETQILSH